MIDLTQTGKMFLLIGVVFLAIGGLFLLANQVPWIGNLPGDFSYESDHVKIYVPLTTMLLISLILTLLLNLFSG